MSGAGAGGRMEDSAAFLERQFHRFVTPEIPKTNRKMFLGRSNPNRQGQDTIRGNQASGIFVTCYSEYVSRRHAEVYFRDGGYFICDMGSLNGTFINNMKLTPSIPHRLQIDDRVGLGMSEDNPEFEAVNSAFFIFTFRLHQIDLPPGPSVSVLSQPHWSFGSLMGSPARFDEGSIFSDVSSEPQIVPDVGAPQVGLDDEDEPPSYDESFFEE